MVVALTKDEIKGLSEKHRKKLSDASPNERIKLIERYKRYLKMKREQKAKSLNRERRRHLFYASDYKYDKYIKSPLWESRKQDLFKNLKVDKPECEVCGSTNKVQVHHNTYENLTSFRGEKDKDLIIVCRDCHHQFHSNLKLYTNTPEVAKDKAYTHSKCNMCSHWKTTHKLIDGPYREINFCQGCYDTFKSKMLDREFIVTLRGGGLGIIRGEVPFRNEALKVKKSTVIRRRSKCKNESR